jgi:hypothetical protein
MTGVPVTRANPRHHVNPGLVFDRLKRLQRSNGIGLGIDRADLGPAARRIAPVQRNDLRFLNAAGIRQHVGTEVDRSARRQNPAPKTFAHQLRQ